MRLFKPAKRQCCCGSGYACVGWHLVLGASAECYVDIIHGRTHTVHSRALQSALDLWLYAHGNFCSKVHGMQKLMSKNASRYLSEHFHVWRCLVEYYFRREIVLQQNAIRRAYALANRFEIQTNLMIRCSGQGICTGPHIRAHD